MSAPFEICRRRSVCAVLASGVVISLTALTGGVAPAFAKPGTDPVGPTITIAPEPAPEPETEVKAAPKPTAGPRVADVPSPVEAPPSVAEAPSAPKEASPKEASPKQRAPEPPPIVEAPPQTPTAKIAEPTTEAPVVTATKPAPLTVASAKPTPSAAATPTSEPPAPRDLAAPTSPATTSNASPKADESTSPSAQPIPPLAETTRATESGEEPATESHTPTTASGQSESDGAESASTAAKAAAPKIETLRPQTLEAPEQDVQLAKSSKIIEEKPLAAPKQDVDAVAKLIDLPNLDRDRRADDWRRGDDGRRADDWRHDDDWRRHNDQVRHASDRDWDRHVRQWHPDWVEYDRYYRPILNNPYRHPVRIVYVYLNAPRIVDIPPLARVLLEVPRYAAYSFTAVVANAVNQAANVAVGTFFGGGYYPGVGMPLPPPPPPVLRYDNVPVRVRYSTATYQPFRVQRIVDMGDDSRYGERKVLLDGVTPAWGQWTQTSTGERQFEVHKTQQFPGLDDPQEAPLPGEYRLQLASDETSAELTRRDVYLLAVAGMLATLSIGAVAWAIVLGRRRSSTL